jgi:hypothetical protein
MEQTELLSILTETQLFAMIWIHQKLSPLGLSSIFIPRLYSNIDNNKRGKSWILLTYSHTPCKCSIIKIFCISWEQLNQKEGIKNQTFHKKLWLRSLRLYSFIVNNWKNQLNLITYKFTAYLHTSKVKIYIIKTSALVIQGERENMALNTMKIKFQGCTKYFLLWRMSILTYLFAFYSFIHLSLIKCVILSSLCTWHPACPRPQLSKTLHLVFNASKFNERRSQKKFHWVQRQWRILQEDVMGGLRTYESNGHTVACPTLL